MIRRFLEYFKNKKTCKEKGHSWERIGFTLGGDWIKCERCKKLEEHLPGLHEPKGYGDELNPK